MIIGIILYALLGGVLDAAGVSLHHWHGWAIMALVFLIDIWSYIGARKGK